MKFGFQMMLMLLLGHVLALSKPIDKLLNKITPICKSTAQAALYVTLFTVLVSLFNWGLGLIFGAVFARKVGEFALRSNIKINYALVGAAGYSGMMVWHGGISGSSLAVVSEEGHFAKIVQNQEVLAQLPDTVPFTETVFSTMNISVSMALIIILPLSMYLIGKKVKPSIIRLSKPQIETEEEVELIGAEKLDHSKLFTFLLGLGIISFAVYKAYSHPGAAELKFLKPDFINFSLLGLVFLFHKNIHKVLEAVGNAISGVSGILLQFPLYFGIMGIMNNSGLIGDISAFFSAHSNETTYPLLTFFSAGVVNVFVPSGGGQWMVQGPIVLETAINMGLSIPKSIMALAYGDQLTNMMQPFWALPLLGITGLKAREILPYTLFLMLVGAVIFIAGLLLF
jgi:short-chain fatty acids transporter